MAEDLEKLPAGWRREKSRATPSNDHSDTATHIEPAKFESRSDAKYWCVIKYPGSPIKEISTGQRERRSRAMPRKGLCAEGVLAQPKSKTPPEFGRGSLEGVGGR